MKISIIGNGNVANQIIIALKKLGISTSYLWSRNTKAALKTANNNNITFVKTLEEILKIKVDLIIISIKDDEISTFYKNQKTENLVVHTSGTVSINALKKLSNRIGVFYPLQTFIKNQDTEWSAIPILVEANQLKDQETLLKVASLLSKRSYLITSKQREEIHVGAVVINNFTNYLASLTYDFLKERDINFDILKPLIEKTSNQILNTEETPFINQTGPAKRMDHKTINKHLQQLNNNKPLKEIYSIFSNQIIKKEKND